MVWYERSKRGKTLPDVDTCSFARMFQQAMQEYTSSTQLFNPQALVKEFITRYMPHERLGDVMSQNREATDFFDKLVGYEVSEAQQRRNVDRFVYPCLAFADFQPPVQWLQTIPNCCRPNTWNHERLLPYISIDLFDEENQNASLQNLVERALNEDKQMFPNFYCQRCHQSIRGRDKQTLIHGIDALPVKIQQTDQNSRLRLGGDLAIITRDDGVVQYTLLGGVQYIPGHFGKYTNFFVQKFP